MDTVDGIDERGFTNAYMRNIRCDCGAPELGHAPDCSWILGLDDAQRGWEHALEDLGTDQGEG